MTQGPPDLFNYTSGSWLVNNELRLAKRRLEFNDDELRRLAAQSVGRTPQDVKTMVKLDEGGFNRIFLVTMHDEFQLIARVPYPVTVPRSFAVASEVATMRFLRAKGLPVPEVYAYSATSDNATGTEYIFMEFVKGMKLTDVWMGLEEANLASVLRQVVELECRIMAIAFPAGGSLYYADDLEKAAGRTTGTIPVPVDGERFCVGPDVRLHMWYGRRSQLNVDRGPYEDAAAILAADARKEIAYLERFGQALLPFQRARREAYKYQKQSPADHIENLERYLRMASLLVPEDPSLHAFRIRHPDLQPSNVMVSVSPDSGRLEIVGLLDWQHTSILPLFLLAGIPDRLQNYGDPVSEELLLPWLPANVDTLGEAERMAALGRHHARLVHFHYAKSLTEKLNTRHNDALLDPVSLFARRLFDRAGAPWEGETHDLKALLVEATEKWDELAGAGVLCPVEFDADDVRRTKEFSERLQLSDENFEACQAAIGFETETWVPIEHCERAKALAAILKQAVLERIPEGETRDKVLANWFLDDMDEEDYM
ncbi:Altered inheritance of mitochondria protein 9, mitochondrial [Trametes pubescens]|uniref:Altered inheritance of mitochondria protein 9, mitochondrial n=1 Tax=Trametes pubescens TaxID=154538 RepID=A0A1M2W4Y9_TRAPU|nr:Altered inheritance of mitochondria protein 9, mitochondrial [Trametes pubescens]